MRSQLNRIKNQAVNDAKNNAHAINTTSLADLGRVLDALSTGDLRA
ncbi:MAG: hypothetical protein QX198_09455 [Methylococcaceae bacterium]